MAASAAFRSRVRFLKRRRGVLDAWVGPFLVGTLWRVHSPSTAGSTWTVAVLDEEPRVALSLGDAKRLLRDSDRARFVQAELFPEPVERAWDASEPAGAFPGPTTRAEAPRPLPGAPAASGGRFSIEPEDELPEGASWEDETTEVR